MSGQGRILVCDEDDQTRRGSKTVLRKAGPDLQLAASEIATNTIRHAGGRKVVRVWREDHRLLTEFCDDGGIDDPFNARVEIRIAR